MGDKRPRVWLPYFDTFEVCFQYFPPREQQKLFLKFRTAAVGKSKRNWEPDQKCMNAYFKQLIADWRGLTGLIKKEIKEDTDDIRASDLLEITATRDELGLIDDDSVKLFVELGDASPDFLAWVMKMANEKEFKKQLYEQHKQELQPSPSIADENKLIEAEIKN